MLYNLIVYVVHFALLPSTVSRCRGAEKIPEGAAVVCGNHTARVDAVVLFLALFLNGNRPAIIGKGRAVPQSHRPVVLHLYGRVPVDRGQG